jgi:agmatine deiminase
MPAEWERHAATWIAWPHHEPDWPGKFEPISWVYAEIVRALGSRERVEILCENEAIEAEARSRLDAHAVSPAQYRLHRVPTNRSWLRDSAPTGVVRNDGVVEWLNWGFNAWAKYDNYDRDVLVGASIAEITGLPLLRPARADGERLVLEGGGIEVNGSGLVLVTEEWLLGDVQVRNPGMNRADYEQVFAEFLGASETIWLGEGAVGDDTHGHIDDIARFASPDTLLLAHEQDPSDENHRRSLDNLKRLRRAASGNPLRVVELPFPRPVMMNGERLPASYANFYVANSVVLVPTFNDPNDRIALDIIAREFPGRDVVGIHSTDLVWGLGTLHCLTQQQPAGQL